jgi:hypothetical protein
MRPPDQIPRFQLDLGIGSRSVNETVGSDPAVLMRQRKSLRHRDPSRKRLLTLIPFEGKP